MKKEEEEEVEEEEESGILAVEEGMVVEGSDEAFGECFSAYEESIKTELLARILVNPASAAVGTAVRGECTRERFLRLRG